MKKRILQSIMFVAIASMMWGCYPGGPSSYDEFDLVYTNHQKDYSYKGKVNYTMPDKVVKINGDTSKHIFVSEPYQSQILARIKSNMAALGYNYVADSTLADFTILPAGLSIDYTYYYYYYDYWYGWYYPYYGGGYYYPYPVTTTYTTGTLFINMIDRKNESPMGKNPAVWVGIVNGLLEGGNYTNRINKSIDQAFNQSQYLHQ